ncbi:MAG: type II and III secretion system protein family protein [Nitrospirota bacterium]|nr:type II and III secretion system protein family protein [Nitrospirota bacterium]MDH5699906.1 type II and III secretion system protein family protein [Nitrospirota bacterium]
MNQTHGFPFTSMVLALGMVLVGYTGALGEGLTTQVVQINEPQELRLTVGESKIVETEAAFKRASVANPEVADQIVLSPKQIYLAGKAAGMTTLTLWGKDGQVANVFQIRVSPDVTRLKEQLHTMLPHESGIQVMSSHDHITLAGNVTNMESLAKALTLAEPYAPQKIINLIQVGGVQQVMMEVKVAEMQRGLMKRLGVNFKRAQKNHRDFSIGLINDLSTIDAINPLAISQSSQTTTLTFPDVRTLASNLVLGFGIGNDLWTLFLDMLKEHNLSKTLAEPTLIAESGQAAEFLVGGEFPIPIPQQLGQVTIKFKEFGVGLKFTPTVLSEGRISVIVNPEVSELDFANGIVTQGFQVPALTTRKVKTVVELGDGQSFAIAGLLQENVKETVSKYPLLGDIPILGALFRSTSFQKNETELIVIVTPHLVKPLDMVKQTLPTDHYLEPNDFELMLMGYVEGVFPEPKVAKPTEAYTLGQPRMAGRMPYRKGGMEGMFGHLAP